MDNIYEKLSQKVDDYKDEMINSSKKIHGYSELAFN